MAFCHPLAMKWVLDVAIGVSFVDHVSAVFIEDPDSQTVAKERRRVQSIGAIEDAKHDRANR